MPVEPTALGLACGGLPGKELLLLTVNLGLSGPQIRILGCGYGVFLNELVAEDHDKVQRDAQIAGDKVLGVERAPLLVMGKDLEVLFRSVVSKK